MKKIIKLTESDLHRVIKESVQQVLSEGKYVNNKPFFDKDSHFFTLPIKPGQGTNSRNSDQTLRDRFWQVRGYENEADAISKNAVDLSDECKMIRYTDLELEKAIKKHNQRGHKYEYNWVTQPNGEREGQYIPQFGKEYENEKCRKNMWYKKRDKERNNYERFNRRNFDNRRPEYTQDAIKNHMQRVDAHKGLPTEAEIEAAYINNILDELEARGYYN